MSGTLTKIINLILQGGDEQNIFENNTDEYIHYICPNCNRNVYISVIAIIRKGYDVDSIRCLKCGNIHFMDRIEKVNASSIPPNSEVIESYFFQIVKL